jgi:enoyl-CoA hydratase/carnithine racemase
VAARDQGGGPARVERDGEVAVVVIDSPPLNLYDAAMHTALEEAVRELQRSSPRAVLFRAEGRVVSGGVDVSLFAAQESVAAATELFERLVGLAREVDGLTCPTVFAAHALCLTWAFELALACDLIVAAQSASFGLVERVVGLTPAMGGTQRLAERAGTGRARELVMTGTRYDAATLERWNVVNRVLPDEGFEAAVRKFVQDLAAGPPLAHAATKQVIREYRNGGLERANDRVSEIAGTLFESEDLRGAIQSFLEHGPGRAEFRGR